MHTDNWPKELDQCTWETDLESADNCCFPWAVVEMKRHTAGDALMIRCHCQVADAAAALDMRTQLFRKLGANALSQPPPIVTSTCIGPIVKVWLAYLNQPGLFKKPKKV
jgi:hypothetical protein